jgi:predicted CopG family antitoxin
MPKIKITSDELTTITLKRDTKESLNDARKGGESWDKFLKRLVERLYDVEED